MGDNYSKLEMALMDLDRAVTGLARQAEGVRKTVAQSGAARAAAAPQARPAKGANQTDLFAALGTLPPEGEAGLEAIERRLDATIAQIEDLLNDDYAVA